MASEIVENDNVALAQGWQEKVLDIGAKAFAVDRPVEDARRGELIVAKRTQERRGAAVAVRREASQPRALGSPSRNGAMLVLIHVSSMKTSRLGSSPTCQDRQR